jgi:hypothetical protein
MWLFVMVKHDDVCSVFIICILCFGYLSAFLVVPISACCIGTRTTNSLLNTIIISIASVSCQAELAAFVVEPVHFDVACVQLYVLKKAHGLFVWCCMVISQFLQLCCKQTVRRLLSPDKALCVARGHLRLLQLTQMLLPLLLLLLLLLCRIWFAATLAGNTAGSVTVTCVRVEGKSFTAISATDPTIYKLEVGPPCWQQSSTALKLLQCEVQTHMQQTRHCIYLS